MREIYNLLFFFIIIWRGPNYLLFEGPLFSLSYVTYKAHTNRGILTDHRTSSSLLIAAFRFRVLRLYVPGRAIIFVFLCWFLNLARSFLRAFRNVKKVFLLNCWSFLTDWYNKYKTVWRKNRSTWFWMFAEGIHLYEKQFEDMDSNSSLKVNKT